MKMTESEQKTNIENEKEYVEEWLFVVKEFISTPNNLRFLSMGLILVVFLPLCLIFFLPDKTGVTANQIGDTFGGIAGPIVNLLAAILVYLSFRTQIKANEIQIGMFENQIMIGRSEKNYILILDMLREYKKEINNFTVKSSKHPFLLTHDKEEFQGRKAIYVVAKTIMWRTIYDPSLVFKPNTKMGDIEQYWGFIQKLESIIQLYKSLFFLEDDQKRVILLFSDLYINDLSRMDFQAGTSYTEGWDFDKIEDGFEKIDLLTEKDNFYRMVNVKHELKSIIGIK